MSYSYRQHGKTIKTWDLVMFIDPELQNKFKEFFKTSQYTV